MKINLAIAVLVLGISSLNAQPTIQWEKSFGGTMSEGGAQVLMTSDGGYITIGTTEVLVLMGESTSNDYFVIKHDNSGNETWSYTYGGSSNDTGTGIQETSDGGYIIIGFSLSDDGDITDEHGSADVWILKLTSSGAMSWQKSYGGMQDEIGSQIKQTSDGGYIVAARSSSIDGDLTGNNGGTDVWLIKLTSTGNITWQKNYGGSGDDGTTCVEITSDGGYIFGGYTSSNDGDVTDNHGNYDYWLLKTNATGDLLWQKTYGGTGDDLAYAIDLTNANGFILAGSSVSNDGDVTGAHGENDYWIVNLDSAGQINWQNALGGINDDDARSIIQTMDGGFVVAGRSLSPNGDDVYGNHGNHDYWVAKLGGSGLFEWGLSLGGVQQDFCSSIHQTDDDGFILVGTSYSNDGDVSEQFGSGDVWMVKLSAFVGIDETENTNLFTLFPNPTADDFVLNFESGALGATYMIYDLAGNLVQEGKITSSQTLISSASLVQGMYIVNVDYNTQTYTLKLTKI